MKSFEVSGRLMLSWSRATIWMKSSVGTLKLWRYKKSSPFRRSTAWMSFILKWILQIKKQLIKHAPTERHWCLWCSTFRFQLVRPTLGNQNCRLPRPICYVSILLFSDQGKPWKPESRSGNKFKATLDFWINRETYLRDRYRITRHKHDDREIFYLVHHFKNQKARAY